MGNIIFHTNNTMSLSKDLATFIAKHNINYSIINEKVNIETKGLNNAIWPNTPKDKFDNKMSTKVSNVNGVKYITLDTLVKMLKSERSKVAKAFSESLSTFTQDVFFALMNSPAMPDDIKEDETDEDTYIINGIKLKRIEKFKDKWSRGKVVAKILGYSDYRGIIETLDDKYKCYLGYLKDDRTEVLIPPFDRKFNPNESNDLEPKDRVVYLNVQGVLHLINVSQKQVAKDIRADMEKIYGKIVLAGECSVNGETLKPKKTAFTTPLTRGRKATPKATKVGDTSLSPRIRSKSRDNLMKNISTIKAGLYFLEINYENEQGDTLYKCGHTKDITTRLNDHETNFGNYTVLHFEPVMASHIAEDAMFDMLKRLGMLQPTQDVDGLSKRELIILGEHTKDDVIEIMGKAAKSTIIDKDILLSMEETARVKIQEESKITQENTKLSQEEIKLKQLAIQLEIAKLNK